MVRQHTLLFEQLEVVEAMRAFISHRMSEGEELHARLERAKNNLVAAQKATAEGAEALQLAEGERKVIRAEADKLRKKGGVAKTKLKRAKQENSQLKKDMEELRAGFTAQKKEMELQIGFAAQKKELEVGFVTQKKELDVEYQKQVDEMYFFGYRCC